MIDDWAREMFPGDGAEIPTDDERDRADELIAEWSTRWNEPAFIIPRWRDSHGPLGVLPTPTNRAFIRSALRRWWAKNDR